MGLVSTELAVMMPIVLLIAIVAVFAGQVDRQSSRAQAAADAAARAASFFVGDVSGAEPAAQAAAEDVCRGPVDLRLEWTDPSETELTPGRVVVTLNCTEQFSGFSPLIDDMSRTEEATAVATLEYWRPTP